MVQEPMVQVLLRQWVRVLAVWLVVRARGLELAGVKEVSR